MTAFRLKIVLCESVYQKSLHRVIEKGTLKCHQYWPASAGETVTCEAVELAITNVNFVPGDHYNVSTLRSVPGDLDVDPIVVF